MLYGVHLVCKSIGPLSLLRNLLGYGVYLSVTPAFFSIEMLHKYPSPLP